MSARDVVVIGAGIIGLNIAWQLRRRSSCRITVLDKGAGVGEGSTGASSAVCRHRYSTEAMIRLAQAGIARYRDWRDYTGLVAPRADYQRDGVLWLAGDDGDWADREHARMRELGIATDVLDARAVAGAYPAINPCARTVDLEAPEAHRCAAGGRHLLEYDGGWIDPVSAAQDLLEACRAGGVEVRFRARVDAIDTQGGRVTGVQLASGEHIAAGTVVSAAGPWCNDIYRAAGLPAPMPLAPVRIQVVHLDRSASLPGHIPVCADVQSGIYFRTQNRGQQLLVSSVREVDEQEVVADPDDFLRVADEQFRLEKLHLLQHRLPGLRLNRSIRDYCGLYTVNQADVHPVVGDYGPDGFFIANGFSGHGFKLAPAIGAAVAHRLSGIALADDGPDLGWLAPHRAPIALASKSVLA